ncbi:Bardet-Biedl syndrome 7 protein [Eumeta japonica]|uniref:Bardet-Biedl syndrome 7 protein n=1 Tax=Eumeta variegata TaxID=151549 RepID=A0A4C1XH33_EUMVA|nr:Bardet-Biedl syndrome 7 protein [Eumeta japonica]
MDYDLTRVDYLLCGVTYPDTLKTIPTSGLKTRQKFTIGDKNGILQCLSIKDEEPYVHFKTLPGKPLQQGIDSFQFTDAQAEKIFAAAGNEIKGYTRKGKVFLTLETTLSETITSMFVLGGDLILGSGRTVTHYRELREMHSYTCDDRVLDLVAFLIPNGTRFRILVLTANKGIILLENGQILSRISIAGGPTRIILPPIQHNTYTLYGAADGSLGIINQDGSELSFTCLMEGHDLGAVVCAGWWLSNVGTHLAIGRHDGSIQLYLIDLENLMGKPRLKFTYFCGEPVTSVCGGFVGTEEGELLVATFSGRVFTLRSQRSMPISAGPAGVTVTPPDALAARRTKLDCFTICLATEFTEFTLSRPARRAGRGNGGGRQSRVGSFELFLFVPRSCGDPQLAVLRARVI